MLLTNLDMDVLRTLSVAMELGGFAKAAARLGRSQSAVSSQMRRLEAQVGQTLFRKNGRNLALTDAGTIVLGYARRILALNDEALVAARGVALAGSVRFGVPQDLAETWLPAVLARFARAHPSVRLEVQIAGSRELLDHLRSQGLDLALVFSDRVPSHAVHLGRLSCAWIGPKGWRRPGSGPVPLVLFEPPCVFREAGIAALERAQVPWRIALTSPSLAAVWAAVGAGLGITVRTALGVGGQIAILDTRAGVPSLEPVDLFLCAATPHPSAAVQRLGAILLETLAISMRDLTSAARSPRRTFRILSSSHTRIASRKAPHRATR